MTPTTKRLLNLVQKLGGDSFLLRASTIPGVRNLINRLAWNRQTLAHCRDIHGRFATRLDRNGITLPGKDILEIGAGNSIGMGYFFARHGYSSWTSSDPVMTPKGNVRAAQQEYVLAKEILTNENPEFLELLSIKDNNISFSGRFKFIELDATEFVADFVEKYDLIFSNSVLEHLTPAGLEATITNCRHYLRPNGIMIHGIDLKDHINPLNPLNFYKYSDDNWLSISKDSIFYVNRLRHVDYINLFERHCFKIIESDPYLPFPLPKDIHPDISGRYDDETLKYGECFIISEKSS